MKFYEISNQTKLLFYTYIYNYYPNNYKVKNIIRKGSR
jgi:hypothetical protein